MSAMRYSRVGRKILRRVGYYAGPTHAHWCPACAQMHDYAVEQPFRNGAQWTFNGDGDQPTFSPSMNISWGPNSRGDVGRCHYFVTCGRIIYCGDSTHALAGKTVDLPDIPEEVLRRVPEVPL